MGPQRGRGGRGGGNNNSSRGGRGGRGGGPSNNNNQQQQKKKAAAAEDDDGYNVDDIIEQLEEEGYYTTAPSQHQPRHQPQARGGKQQGGKRGGRGGGGAAGTAEAASGKGNGVSTTAVVAAPPQQQQQGDAAGAGKKKNNKKKNNKKNNRNDEPQHPPHYNSHAGAEGDDEMTASGLLDPTSCEPLPPKPKQQQQQQQGKGGNKQNNNNNNNKNNNDKKGGGAKAAAAPAGGAVIQPLQLDIHESDATASDDRPSRSSSQGGSDGGQTEEDFSDAENERAREYRPGGYHPVSVGELYNDRYRIAHKLGWGYFSTVWLVWDYTTSSFFAMKVQKSASQYYDAAFDEIKLLSEINAAAEQIHLAEQDERAQRKKALKEQQKTTDNGKPAAGDAEGAADLEEDRSMESPSHPQLSAACHCARLYDYFEHRGPHGVHVCMVFEVLGENLLKLIERYEYRGIPLPIVKNIAKQTLEGLRHIHAIDIIHTDLKPENVLIARPPHKIDKLMKSYVAPPLQTLPSLLGKNVANMTKSQRKRYNLKLRKMKAAQQQQGGGAPTGAAAPPAAKGGKKKPEEEEDASEESGAESGEEAATKKKAPKHVDPTTGENDAAAADEKKEGEEDTPSEPDPDWELQRIQEVCLADFGNSCWTDKQFTDEVQTRQYRAPEVILGNGYGTAIDVWSAACMFFELLTGEFLFDPKQHSDYCRDEDHLALMIELLGPLPEFMVMPGPQAGKFRRQYVGEDGNLLHISDLKYWPLDRVLHEKYKFSKKKSREISDFLLPMLDMDPQRRATADEMLNGEAAVFFEDQEDDFRPYCYSGQGVADADESVDSEYDRRAAQGLQLQPSRGEDDESSGSEDGGSSSGSSWDEENNDEEDDEFDMEKWLEHHPLLMPESLAAKGLTIFEIKAALAGGEAASKLSPEKVEKIDEILAQMRGEAAQDYDEEEEEDEEDDEESEGAEAATEPKAAATKAKK